MDSDEMLGDVVASIVEKILMNIGFDAHAKISNILEAHNLNFSDCYKNPDVLNFALKEVFDHDYISIVEKIRKEFGGIVDDDQRLVKFMQKLSE
ncbi:hypothetical protein [Candidatus Nitrosotalea okcheonensis]|uniref:Nitrosopumilus output domain-containing protein n=1 Tax=Candidatus Nitrosotalea okcheonensis TaxID=1903276 RepID=A0A2H1FCI0_9ARCH|nr:hypothetical protein [Candidatus Nitrosotalea okcheonensis]SMH70461.1 protein of unknown function [Candidatus Nitrosotalea okcheonensis]